MKGFGHDFGASLGSTLCFDQRQCPLHAPLESRGHGFHGQGLEARGQGFHEHGVVVYGHGFMALSKPQVLAKGVRRVPARRVSGSEPRFDEKEKF